MKWCEHYLRFNTEQISTSSHWLTVTVVYSRLGFSKSLHWKTCLTAFKVEVQAMHRSAECWTQGLPFTLMGEGILNWMLITVIFNRGMKTMTLLRSVVGPCCCCCLHHQQRPSLSPRWPHPRCNVPVCVCVCECTCVCVCECEGHPDRQGYHRHNLTAL